MNDEKKIIQILKVDEGGLLGLGNNGVVYCRLWDDGVAYWEVYIENKFEEDREEEKEPQLNSHRVEGIG